MARGPGPDYEVPSLEVIRPITNVSLADIAQFEDEVFDLADQVGNRAENRAAFQGVQFRDQAEPQITLVSADEMARFHEYHGFPLTRANVGLLKDHIKKNLHDGFHEDIKIPVTPAAVYRAFPKTGPSRALVALGAGKRAIAERHAVQRVIHGFYDFPKTEEEITKVWSPNEPLRRVPLVEIWGHPKRVEVALGIINLALEQTDVFSSMLECDPVKRERKGVYRKR